MSIHDWQMAKLRREQWAQMSYLDRAACWALAFLFLILGIGLLLIGLVVSTFRWGISF